MYVKYVPEYGVYVTFITQLGSLFDSYWSIIGHYFLTMTGIMDRCLINGLDLEHLSALPGVLCLCVSNMTAM